VRVRSPPPAHQEPAFPFDERGGDNRHKA
jgi:hypothetical protein